MTNITKLNDIAAPTMNSLEIVSLINSMRGEEDPELRHSDFLAKVPKVLSGGERNFSSSYLSEQNKELPCYNFPKREACLLAMSYSYELQAAVFDRMTELETQANSAALTELWNVEQNQKRLDSIINALDSIKDTVRYSICDVREQLESMDAEISNGSYHSNEEVLRYIRFSDEYAESYANRVSDNVDYRAEYLIDALGECVKASSNKVFSAINKLEKAIQKLEKTVKSAAPTNSNVGDCKYKSQPSPSPADKSPSITIDGLDKNIKRLVAMEVDRRIKSLNH